MELELPSFLGAQAALSSPAVRGNLAVMTSCRQERRSWADLVTSHAPDRRLPPGQGEVSVVAHDDPG